jgi:hypothetical protein
MLHVDFDEGRYEIVQRVTRYCAAYGNIKSIRIFIESNSTAVVEMATKEQTEYLSARLGGRMVGSTAFVALRHKSRKPVASISDAALATLGPA